MATQTLVSHIATQPEWQDRLYKQVALRIAELIEHGTLRPGERVPSVRELSEREEVSIATVMQAYRVLESRGLIEARPQSGYYVRAKLWAPPPEPSKSQPTRSATRVSVNDLVMEVLKATHSPALVGFGAAMPSPQLLPTLQLHRTMASVARRHSSLCNSCDIPPGNLNLRTQIARRAMGSGCTLSPDEIVTTCGCQEALNLCLRAVAKPGDTIAIESPTYYGILQIIEALGMKACEIPTFPREGVCLDELVKRLKCCRIKACMFSLNFSNPLGSCMPDVKKARLVKILADRGIPLIEDDLYGNLSHSPHRPKTAKAFDKNGLVLLCDSFTKTLAPGGYDHHLRKLRRFYAEQVPRVTQAITKYFPAGTKVTRPTGGYVLWVELPPQINSLELFRKALAEKISIAPGPIFSAKQKLENFIRLSCGSPWSEAMDQALLKLGQLSSRMM